MKVNDPTSYIGLEIQCEIFQNTIHAVIVRSLIVKASVNDIHVSGQPPTLENWHRSRSHYCIIYTARAAAVMILWQENGHF